MSSSSATSSTSYVTVREAARRFGVKSRTIRDWIRRGILEAKRDRVTGTLYVPRAELERREAELEAWTPKSQSTGAPATEAGAPLLRPHTHEGDRLPKEPKQEASAAAAAATTSSTKSAKKKAKRVVDDVDRDIWGDDDEDQEADDDEEE